MTEWIVLILVAPLLLVVRTGADRPDSRRIQSTRVQRY